MSQVVDTSLDAYFARVLPRLADSQAEVFQVLSNATSDMTNNEIAKALGWSICRVTGRMKELRDMGLVVSNGKRRCGVTQNRVYSWKLR